MISAMNKGLPDRQTKKAWCVYIQQVVMSTWCAYAHSRYSWQRKYICKYSWEMLETRSVLDSEFLWILKYLHIYEISCE